MFVLLLCFYFCCPKTHYLSHKLAISFSNVNLFIIFNILQDFWLILRVQRYRHCNKNNVCVVEGTVFSKKCYSQTNYYMSHIFLWRSNSGVQVRWQLLRHRDGLARLDVWHCIDWRSARTVSPSTLFSKPATTTRYNVIKTDVYNDIYMVDDIWRHVYWRSVHFINAIYF